MKPKRVLFYHPTLKLTSERFVGLPHYR